MLDRTHLLGVALLIILSVALPVAPVSSQDSPRLSSSSVPNWNTEFIAQYGGATQVVAVRDHFAYLGVGQRLVVVDITNPARPAERGTTLPLPTALRAIALSGNFAFVAAGSSGLHIVDVSTPSNPKVIGSYDTVGDSADVAVNGTYAYVADSSGGLRIVDVSDPTSPRLANVHWMAGGARRIALQGAIAYVTTGSGLRILDVSDPNHVAERGAYRPDIKPPMVWSVTGVAAAGRYIYLSTGEMMPGVDLWRAYLEVIDVSDQGTPTAVSKTGLGIDAAARLPAIHGDRLVVLSAWKTILFSIEDPSKPAGLGILQSAGISGVALSSDHLYMADAMVGLRIFDISQPETFPEVGFLARLASPHSVGIAGQQAYLGQGNGLSTVDVSIPTRPRLTTGQPVTGLTSLATTLRHVYLGLGVTARELRVVDIADAAQPRQVGTVRIGNDARDIAIAGGRAYVAGCNRMDVIDVADPSRPVLIGVYTARNGLLEQCLTSVAAAGGRVYALDSRRLHVVDVSNPRLPRLTGSLDFDAQVEKLAVAGNHALVVGRGAGLRIIDIGDPARPREVGALAIPGGAISVAVTGEYAAIGTQSSGLRVVKVTNPGVPQEVGYYRAAGGIHDIAADGGLLYLAEEGAGLTIIRLAMGTSAPPADPASPGCSWSGTWDTHADGQFFELRLEHNGMAVSGSYAGDRRLQAIAEGLQLAGRWSAPPTYLEPEHAGRFAFSLAPDCNLFSGTWGFGDQHTGGGMWSGARVGSPPSDSACDWGGGWETRETRSGNETFPLSLRHSGGQVSGTYGIDRRIDGTAAGWRLTGRWSGPPTYAEPDHAGRFVFELTTDCKSFVGTWGFGDQTSGAGAWSGRRSALGPAPALLWPPALTVLPRLSVNLAWENPPGTTQVHLKVIPFNSDGPGADLIFGWPNGNWGVGMESLERGPFLLLPDMGYTWTVRTSGSPKPLPADSPEWGFWAPPRSFRTPTVSSSEIQPLAPAPGSNATRTPTLQWSKTPVGVFYYEIQLSWDRDFAVDPSRAIAPVYWNLIHGGMTNPLNSWTVPDAAALEAGTTYYWRVRPRIQGDGVPVDWGPVWHFTVR